MKDQTVLKQYFPHNTIGFIFLLLASMLIISPIIFLESLVEEQLFMFLIFSLLGISVVAMNFIINKERKIKISYNFKIINHKFFLIVILSTIIFQLGINAPLNSIVANILEPNKTSEIPFSSFFFMFGAIITGPFIEEVLFRGIFLKGLLQNNKPVKAIIISALLFAIIHISPYQFIGALYFGAIFGYEYYKTKSIGNTIILHSCANISGLLSAYMFSKYYIEIVIENQIYCILFIVASCITVLFLLNKLRKYFLS